MRVSLLVPALYALAASAAPLPNEAQAGVEATAPKFVTNYNPTAILGALPSLRKLLDLHPNIEADVAKHNPFFALSSNPNALDFNKIKAGVNMLNVNQEPAPATDLAGATLSALMSLLGYLPGAITGGVGSILSAEYSLITGIFSGLWSLVPSFGFGSTPASVL